MTHLVAHAFRELASAVQSVLEPADAAEGVKEDRHRAKIRAVLDDLGISHEDAVAVFWLGMAGQDSPDNLAGRAHRLALDPPRPVDEDFLGLIDRFEQVLDAIMEQFESRYFQVFERLDLLLKISTPTKADANTLKQSFPHTQVVSGYFFSRASATWLLPLRQVGYFSSPPSPEVDDNAGTVQMPSWAESEYLARIASAAPKAAVETVLLMPATDNSRVHRDIVMVGGAVSPELGARLVPTIVQGIQSRFGMWFPDEVGALMAALCQGGEVDAAMTLARVLLAQLPNRYGPTSSVDAYEYGLVLQQYVPLLVDKVGVDVLAELSVQLAKVISREMEERGEEQSYDGSMIWRPNIAGRQVAHESDLRHMLVDVVRDSAQAIIDSDQDKISEVVGELESHSWPIFRRLALYVLSQYVNKACDLVNSHLVNREIIQDSHLDHEYLLLAHHGASCLNPYSLRRLINLIDEGPQPQAARIGALSPTANSRIAEPLAPERVARWKRDRLGAIRSALPPDRDARYQALVAEYGEAPDPTLPAPQSFAVWSGQIEEAIRPGELATMPTDDLIELLRTWQPSNDRWPAVSSASLRGALSSVVQREPARWSNEASAFIGLPAIYVSAVLNGLWQAAQTNVHLDWAGILELLAWINREAESALVGEADSSVGGEWRGLRLEMIQLLAVGLTRQSGSNSSDLDLKIWSIIESCCQDPTPTLEDEAGQALEERSVFLALAESTIRPQGLRSAVSYGLRLRQRSPDSVIEYLLILLDRHLDSSYEPSRAVRSVYGEEFARLVLMDREWTRRNASRIFPLDLDQSHLLEAAWDGYLLRGNLNSETWDLLTDVYSAMVDRMESEDQDRVAEFRVEALGSHLINRLWNGQIDLESHNSLLRRFYLHASKEVAKDLLRSVGFGLKELDYSDPALIERLTRLWEFRVEAARNGSDAGELAEFGRWFASGCFDASWSSKQVLVTLTLAGRIEVDGSVFSKLAEIASEHTQVSLAILDRWLRVSPKPWRIVRHIDSVRQIVRVGLAGDLTAVTTSRIVISLLVRDYGIDLRDLIAERTR
ncbi:hypothetical protein FDA94_24715 [Herbidospora galbida]|uniref:Uncharacterized protein n=1 Tax=Herbidospora galbida TaxID=2575442 RepID=A0A4U3MB90_9ACTN|nr:hypothetical protein [Herbidospora galbida]TKK85599.1 hypothetical protein FDA94_24715 [Herbidospora galbida]